MGERTSEGCFEKSAEDVCWVVSDSWEVEVLKRLSCPEASDFSEVESGPSKFACFALFKLALFESLCARAGVVAAAVVALSEMAAVLAEFSSSDGSSCSCGAETDVLMPGSEVSNALGVVTVDVLWPRPHGIPTAAVCHQPHETCRTKCSARASTGRGVNVESWSPWPSFPNSPFPHV